MNVRTIVYNLRTVNDKPILSIDLTGKIIDENSSEIVISLPTGTSTIRKAQYLNNMKIYEVDEKLFFIICSKAVSRKYAFNVLMNHAIGKIERRVEKLQLLKTQYSNQLQVA